MATLPKGSDRRVQKTREVIRKAFVEVVRKKGLIGATVQEVAEQANVSRGTFYAHYADKYELVDSIVRENFQQAISAAFSVNSKWSRKTLHTLTQTILEYFRKNYQLHRRSRDIAPLLEQTIHYELNKVVLILLKKNETKENHSHISVEAIANIFSWMIFGAAIQWSQKGNTISSEQMTYDVVALIMDGVTQLSIQSNEKT